MTPIIRSHWDGSPIMRPWYYLQRRINSGAKFPASPHLKLSHRGGCGELPQDPRVQIAVWKELLIGAIAKWISSREGKRKFKKKWKAPWSRYFPVSLLALSRSSHPSESGVKHRNNDLYICSPETCSYPLLNDLCRLLPPGGTETYVLSHKRRI